MLKKSYILQKSLTYTLKTVIIFSQAYHFLFFFLHSYNVIHAMLSNNGQSQGLRILFSILEIITRHQSNIYKIMHTRTLQNMYGNG